MITTMTPRVSSWAVLLLVALGSCQGYQLQLPNQPRAAFFAAPQRRIQLRGYGANACPPLSVAADFNSDFDFEAALGQAHGSEYDRDAEFYRKRNEAYTESLPKTKDEDVIAKFSFPDSQAQASPGSNYGAIEPLTNLFTDSINTSMKASENSFTYVEKSTFSLLKQRPMMALLMFAVTGVTVAYLSGFFFLEGYIEDWNPVANDLVPYWDDAEIHTIERVLPVEPSS